MNAIPKIIHYCWFGRGPMDIKTQSYIESWKKHCKDYKIIEWNEDNYDIEGSCQYVREAYHAGKWAFVADYVRLYALYKMGGIYLDTDVEVLKSYDELLDNEAFMCSESMNSVCTATIGAKQGSAFIGELLDIYENRSFINSLGRQDLTPNSQVIRTLLEEKYSYSYSDSEIYSNGIITVYPAEYFSPINCYTLKGQITENTYSVHRYAGSWKTESDKRKEVVKSYITRIIGENKREQLKQYYYKYYKREASPNKCDEKPHVCFLINNMSHGGGTERATSIIANALCDSCEVYIYSCREGYNHKYTLNEKVTLRSFEGERIKNPVLRKLDIRRRLLNALTEDKITCAIAVDIDLCLYYVSLIGQLKRMNIKTVGWEHFNYYQHVGIKGYFVRKAAARLCDSLVVLGKRDKANYLKHEKFINDIRCIYNTIAVTPLTDEQIISKSINRTVLSVGRLEEEKGFDYLIDAWKIVNEKCPEWKLNIVGSGSKAEELRRQIQYNKLENVSLIPYTDNIDEYYMRADIYVSSSRFEGFPLSLLEAQAKGLPIVSFNCKEGPAEIVRDGVNGFLVPPGDVNKLADRIIELINDGKMRRSFSIHSRDDHERFELVRITNKWKRLVGVNTCKDKKIRSSAVVATYNGSKDIIRQLSTIMYQTEAVDEVIIGDDCSTDDTYEVISQFISDNKLDSWKLYANEKNLGWKENFARLIAKTSGDIVFLSDQDDEWTPDKVKRMKQAFVTLNDKLIVSNMNVEYLQSGLHNYKHEKLSDKICSHVKPTPIRYRIMRPGCTFAVNGKWARQCINTYWKEGLPHDLLLWQCAYLENSIGIVNLPLVKYRRSVNSQTAVKNKSRLDERLIETNAIISCSDSSQEILTSREKSNSRLNTKKMADRCIKLEKHRKMLFETGNIYEWLCCFKYLDCYLCKRSWLVDLLCSIRR